MGFRVQVWVEWSAWTRDGSHDSMSSLMHLVPTQLASDWSVVKKVVKQRCVQTVPDDLTYLHGPLIYLKVVAKLVLQLPMLRVSHTE